MRASGARGRLRRRRLCVALAIAITIAAGLFVRSEWAAGMGIGKFWAKHLGVGLWAVAMYWAVAFVMVRARVGVVAAVALAASWGVELMQLTPVPREVSSWHPVPRLVFGEAFGWRDLVSLGVGVGAAAMLDAAALRWPRLRHV